MRTAPPIPRDWPTVAEHPECRRLWSAAASEASRGIVSRLKRMVRRVAPAKLLARVEQKFFRVKWEGDYPDWAAARAACSGYEAPTIMGKVLAAARLARDGRATYERDGVAFHGPAPWWPGLAVLQEEARLRGGALTVLDFGGSLGSLYFQCRGQLRVCDPLRWRVVEQPAFVEAGRREFQTEELEFYSSVSEACDAGMPDVVLLASVLPYLPSPYEILSELLRTRASRVVVDRTGFVTGGNSRLTVQRVPRSIYPASYPCWFLNRAEFLSAFGRGFRLTHEHRDDVATPTGLEFRSWHFSRVAS